MSSMLCGAAEIDITPNNGLPMAGYSTDGQISAGILGHLFARALYIEDANGDRVAICLVDLHSGTRYLLERAAARTKAACGIGVDRLLLAGTHTHTGPGNIYGNSFYDTFSQKIGGFDRRLADWLAGRIARAVKEAAASKEPALLGFAERELWGESKNRSPEPFLHNLDAHEWNESGRPGANAPAGLLPAQRMIDPRISVIAAFREADRSVIGAVGFFGCHTTTLGMKAEYFAPDWAGYAARRARWALERTAPSKPVVVGIGLSGAADAHGLRSGLPTPWRQSPSLARRVGLKVGVEVAAAVRAARDTASAVEVSSLYAEPTLASGADYPQQSRLAKEWMIGASTLAGAEDGRTGFFENGWAHEGMTDHSTPVPQRPKSPAFGVFQEVLHFLLGAEPGPVLPLHAIRLGDHLLVTVPGEPTAHTAWDIERATASQSGAARVIVVGYAGDYIGYFPTAREYDLQHYEGASALFGRYSANHVKARLVELLKAGQTGPLQPRPIKFKFPDWGSEFAPPEDLSCRDVKPRPKVERTGGRVTVRWEMGWFDKVGFADDWFVRVEHKKGTKWEPIVYRNRVFDDVHAEIQVERTGDLIFGRQTTYWRAIFRLPPAWKNLGSLRVRVNRRGEFEGFTRGIPAG